MTRKWWWSVRGSGLNLGPRPGRVSPLAGRSSLHTNRVRITKLKADS